MSGWRRRRRDRDATARATRALLAAQTTEIATMRTTLERIEASLRTVAERGAGGQER